MRALGVAVATCLLVGWQPYAALAGPTSCSGVWVVVEDELSCTTEFPSGEQALLNSGHTVEKKGSMVCRIDGRPDRCHITFDAYWSYWQSDRQPDGSYAEWEYATVGAASHQPKAGDAEGWAFGPGEPPAVLPPANSYHPEQGADDPPASGDPVPTSSPIPTIATLAAAIVGGTALRIAHQRREAR